jgi:hypothetical protein
LQNTGLGLSRDFTFQAVQVADVPPAGEVLMVVLGDLRAEWPNEPGALRMLRVDIDAEVRPIGRDPEVAFFNLDSNADIEFSVPAPPSIFVVATVPECAFGDCPVPVERFAPGMQQFFVGPPGGGSTSGEYPLEGGRRYVLAYTETNAGELLLWEDSFEHADDLVSTGRGFGLQDPGDTLTIGRIFGGMGQPFDAFVDMPRLVVSDEQDLPTAGWDLTSALNGGTLGTACFSIVATDAGWRGLVNNDVFVDLTAWPPQLQRFGLVCA